MKAGDEQRCPRCGQWHELVTSGRRSGRDFEDRMLWVVCRGDTYFAGSELNAWEDAPRCPIRSSTVTCLRCRDTGWLCEQHRSQEHPHGDCAGPGIPCPSCNDGSPPRMPAGFVSHVKVEE